MLVGEATIYLCENFTCKKPMTDALQVASVLHSDGEAGKMENGTTDEHDTM